MGLKDVGFIGLGAMGGGVAINLAREGYNVKGFDLAQPLVDALVKEGGKAAKTQQETATDVDYLCIMVANHFQTSSALFDGDNPAIKGLGQDKTIILLSTTPPSYLHELRQKLDDAGRSDVKLLDCPVSGGTIRAANGTLSIFAAGKEEEVEASKDILNTMSGNLYRIQGGISSGTKVKTIHQLLAATNIILASEAMGLAATVGINTQKVVDHVKANDGTSFMFENRAPHMLQDDWSPLSALGIILKDCGIVTATARQGYFPTPLADCAEQCYLQGLQAGLLRDDDAKLVTMYIPSSSASLVKEMATADVKMHSNHQVSADTVNDLLAGVHLAASVEAMAFCKHLGMDRKLMCEIISKAAGWCDMYTKHIPAMLEKDDWSLASCAAADDVRKRLECAVDKARALKYPCPMASAALQQFYFAGLRG
jgi:3-hydroxyisobutyrate dehydrogenase